MKKSVGMLFATIIALGTLVISASAETDTSSLIAPQRAYVQMYSAGATATNVKDENNIRIIGHELSSTSTGSVSTNETRFAYEDATWGLVGRKIRNNFVWDFDINVESMDKNMYIALGWNGQKSDGGWYTGDRMIFFKSGTKYGIRWNDNKSGISSSDIWYASLDYSTTYHMTVKVNIFTRIVDIDFTKPDGTLIHSIHTMGLDLDPAAATKYTNDALFDLVDDPNKDNTNYAFSFKTGGETAYKATISNETLYYETAIAKTPVISVNNGIVTASQNVKNVWNTTINAPTIILAVYDKTGKLIESKFDSTGAGNGKIWGLSGYTKDQTVDVTGYENGVYTVKEFIWDGLNSIDNKGMRPLGGAYIQKTLTIENGSYVISD